MSNEPNPSALPPEPPDDEAIQSPEGSAAEVPTEQTAPEPVTVEEPVSDLETVEPAIESTGAPPPSATPDVPAEDAEPAVTGQPEQETTDEPVGSDADVVAAEPTLEEPPVVASDDEAERIDEDEESDEDLDEDVEPLEYLDEEEEEEPEKAWYILKVQVNREESIRDALQRRVQIEGLDRYFGDIIVPTEDVAEFTKTGKRRIVKRKLYPGYIMVHMAINDDTWFLVRETPGIGDFTGSAGKPTPMDPREVERILKLGQPDDEGEAQVKTAIPFKPGDRVRVKEGYFQNTEGEVESIDEANGRVTVMIVIFGRSTPVELEHWQIEPV